MADKKKTTKPKKTAASKKEAAEENPGEKKAEKKEENVEVKKAPKQEPKRRTALTQATESLQKLFGKDDTTLVPLDESLRTAPMEHLPTGSVVLDYIIGGRLNPLGVPPCPGFPCKRIVEVYGKEGSGKTTVALNVIRETLRRDPGASAVFVDFEHALSRDLCEQMGLPIYDRNRFQLRQPETLEQGMSIMLVAAGLGVDLVVLDSVGAVVPVENYEKTVEEQAKNVTGPIGLIARKWSAFVPRFQGVLARTGTTLIAIAQMRKNLSGYGSGDTPQGGETWKYYSSVRLRLARKKLVTVADYDPITNKQVQQSVGLEVRVTVDKSKVSGSVGTEAVFYLRFGDGIDDARSVIEIAAAHDIITKSGSWYVWDGFGEKGLRGQGGEGFRAALVENPGALQQLTAQVVPILRGGKPPKPKQKKEGNVIDLGLGGDDDDDIKT